MPRLVGGAPTSLELIANPLRRRCGSIVTMAPRVPPLALACARGPPPSGCWLTRQFRPAAGPVAPEETAEADAAPQSDALPVEGFHGINSGHGLAGCATTTASTPKVWGAATSSTSSRARNLKSVLPRSSAVARRTGAAYPLYWTRWRASTRSCYFST